MTYSREELFELAASYALGATTPEESAAMEAALPGWPELAAEVASFREVTVQLAQIKPVAPSAGVRDQLMRVSRELPAEAMPDVKKGEPRRAQWPWMLAAASVVAVSALSFAVLRERSRAEALGAKLEHREFSLNTILHAEKDLKVVHMKAADTVKGPGIQFFWNEKERMGMAHAFRLTPVPPGKSYQLWIIRDGKPVSVKVFNSDPDGHAMVEGLDLPPTSKGVTFAYLTVEPFGGSPAPTSDPILKGEF